MGNAMGRIWDTARILVVDDELPVRTALQATLGDFYEVVLAEDAVQAERVLETLSIQVIVTDFNLPGRSGTDLITSVLDRFPEVVVILLTGYTSKPAVCKAGRDRNVFAVLNKPYEPAALLRSLRLAVATSHLLALRHGAQSSKTPANPAGAANVPALGRSTLPRPLGEGGRPLSSQRK